MSRSALLRAVPLALLLAVPLIFFSPVLGPLLGGDQALVPVHTDELGPWKGEVDAARLDEIRTRHQPLLLDTTICFHPHLVATLARLRAGEAPLWNPNLLAGVPLLAQAVHGALHPPLLLATLLPFPMAYGWLALLQTLIAGLLMYRLAREFDAPPWASCLAGLAFAFCGYASVRFHFFQVHGAAIWLPGVLLGVERLFKGARWGAIACIALCLGFSLLAGFPQGSLHILYAGAAFGAVRFVSAWRAGGAARASGLRAGWAFALALALGLALGAPQLLPAADMASDPDSTRRAISTEEVASFGMRPTTLLAALAPDLFGMPSDLAAHELPHLRQDGVMRRLFCKPTGNFVETTSSFGLAPLLLALLGLTLRRRGAGLAGGLMLAGVLLSVDTPLLPWALHLPGLDIGDPKRFLLLFAAGGALAAALGLDRLVRSGPPMWFVRSVGVMALVGVLGAVVALTTDEAGWARAVSPGLAAATGLPETEIAAHAGDLAYDLELLRSSLMRFALLAVLCTGGFLIARRRAFIGAAVLFLATPVDLGNLAARSNAMLPADGWYAAPPGLDALADDEGGRMVRFHPGGTRDVMGYPLPPSTGLAFGLRDVSGYVALSMRRLEALYEMVQPGTSTNVGPTALTDPAALDSLILDAMAVTRVLSSVPLDRPGLLPRGKVGNVWVYANENAMPRAWMAFGIVTVSDEEAARKALVAPGADPTRRPVVEGLLSETLSPARALGELLRPGIARITRDLPELVEVTVRTERDEAVLILADSWMSGWSAEVDGEPAVIRPANLAFRAVAVPKGLHTVTFRYRSRGWDIGWPAAVLALLVIGAGFVVGRLGARRRAV
jgi:hypothetical protein